MEDRGWKVEDRGLSIEIYARTNVYHQSSIVFLRRCLISILYPPSSILYPPFSILHPLSSTVTSRRPDSNWRLLLTRQLLCPLCYAGIVAHAASLRLLHCQLLARCTRPQAGSVRYEHRKLAACATKMVTERIELSRPVCKTGALPLGHPTRPGYAGILLCSLLPRQP
jgi:hypothetical protein